MLPVEVSLGLTVFVAVGERRVSDGERDRDMDAVLVTLAVNDGDIEMVTLGEDEFVSDEECDPDTVPDKEVVTDAVIVLEFVKVVDIVAVPDVLTLGVDEFVAVSVVEVVTDREKDGDCDVVGVAVRRVCDMESDTDGDDDGDVVTECESDGVAVKVVVRESDIDGESVRVDECESVELVETDGVLVFDDDVEMDDVGDVDIEGETVEE